MKDLKANRDILVIRTLNSLYVFEPIARPAFALQEEGIVKGLFYRFEKPSNKTGRFVSMFCSKEGGHHTAETTNYILNAGDRFHIDCKRLHGEAKTTGYITSPIIGMYVTSDVEDFHRLKVFAES